MFTDTPTIQTFRIPWTVGTLRCNFTKLPRKTFATFALKVTFFGFNAGAPVETRRRLAFVDDLIAVFTTEAGLAIASVRTVVVEADAIVLTWISSALVNVFLAEISNIAGSSTVARETVNLIDASPIVLTRLRFTIVEVGFASNAKESIRALTFKCLAVGWNSTRSVIEARVLLAQWMRVDRRLAEMATKLGGAEAFVISDSIFFTSSTVSAWILFAWRPQVFVAVLATVSSRAVTFILVGSRCALAMHAREVQAVIDELTDKNIVIGVALTGSERTRAEENTFD